MTWPSHDLTPQQTSRHQNTSLQSTKHHHHGTAEGSFTAKKWFGHRAGRSPCAHSIGKFFLCYIVLFLLETSAPGLSGHYWYITVNFKSCLSMFFILEALQFPRYQDIFEEAVCAHSLLISSWSGPTLLGSTNLMKFNEINLPCDKLHKSLSKKGIGRWFMSADNMFSSIFFAQRGHHKQTMDTT